MKQVKLKWKALGGFRYLTENKAFGRNVFLIEKALVGSNLERWLLWYATEVGSEVYVGDSSVEGYDSNTKSFDTLQNAKKQAVLMVSGYGNVLDEVC